MNFFTEAEFQAFKNKYVQCIWKYESQCQGQVSFTAYCFLWHFLFANEGS